MNTTNSSNNIDTPYKTPEGIVLSILDKQPKALEALEKLLTLYKKENNDNPKGSHKIDTKKWLENLKKEEKSNFLKFLEGKLGWFFEENKDKIAQAIKYFQGEDTKEDTDEDTKLKEKILDILNNDHTKIESAGQAELETILASINSIIENSEQKYTKLTLSILDKLLYSYRQAIKELEDEQLQTLKGRKNQSGSH